MPAQLRLYVPVKPRESALIPFCNVPPSRGQARLHLAAFQDIDYPHRPTHVFSAHFVLTRAHPGRSSRSVTHPEIAPGQARLTLEFFRDRLSEKKLQLVDMSILSILLSSWAGVSHPHPLKRPTSSSVNLKSGTSSLGHVPYVQCQRPMCDVRASSANDPCAMSVRPVPTVHPRCPRTDPPRARAHAGGICAPTRPYSCLRTYARTCP